MATWNHKPIDQLTAAELEIVANAYAVEHAMMMHDSIDAEIMRQCINGAQHWVEGHTRAIDA
jgi:hypothetical protein